MKDNSPESPENKRFFDRLKFLAGIYEIIGERFTAEYQRKQLLKEWIEAFLKEKEKVKPTHSQKPIDTTQHNIFKEKVTTLFEGLNTIVESYVKKIAEISAKATAIAHKTVDDVLTSKGIPPLSTTGVAARNMANMAYHEPTLMHFAKGILTPTTTPGKTHTPFTVASEEHILKSTHKSLHHHIKSARDDLVRSLEKKPAQHEIPDEFFKKFAKLNACMSHAHALHKTCAANPHQDHSVFIEAAESILSSVGHAQFLHEISTATAEAFKQFEIATANATHEMADKFSKMGNFFAFFPPISSHSGHGAEEYIHVQPKRK